MSNNLIQAGEAVQHLGQAYRAVIALGEELTRIGSIDAYVAEVQARLGGELAREAEAVAATARAHDGLQAALEDASEKKQAIANDIEKILSDNDARAHSALEEADARIAALHDKAEAARKAFARDYELQAAELARLAGEIEESGAEFEALKLAIVELKAKFS